MNRFDIIDKAIELNAEESREFPATIYDVAIGLGVSWTEILSVCRACGIRLLSGGTVGVSDSVAEQNDAGLVISATTDGTHPHRVLKDTLIQRIKAAGSIETLMLLLQQLSPSMKFEFDHSSWFSSASPDIIGAMQALGLDPDEILKIDPLYGTTH